MDYNNQNPYEQNSGTDPYGQNSGTSPYTQGQDIYGQSSNTQSQNPYGQSSNPQSQNPYGQSGTQGQNPYGQSSAQGQDPYGQSSAQQTTAGQGVYSQGQGTQDSGQNSYYQQNPYGQNSYQQSQYQGYQGYQSYQYGSDMEEPMSVKEWLIVDLLMLIPCVNLILVFVWAFSSGEKKSKSNFFKANLIFAGCILAFYLVLLLIAFGAGFASLFY